MAYHYDKIATTQKGKIIYPRKPHSFRGRDLQRIAGKVQLPIDPWQQYCYLQAAIEILENVQLIDNSAVQNAAKNLVEILKTYSSSHPEFEGFGGGTFGGAGASRLFGLPFPVWEVEVEEEEEE